MYIHHSAQLLGMDDKHIEQIRKAFGANIRHLRKDRGFSQESFAFECNLHRTYIGAIERGEQNVSLDNIARIAYKLNTPIESLFSK